MIKAAQETLDRLKSVAYKEKRADDAELNAGVGGDESVSEAVSSEIFSAYDPRVIKALRPDSRPHPGEIAEAASLSAIQLPATDYPLWDAFPKGLVEDGKLSQLQLEGVLCACAKHQTFLPSGQRAGFFIGDGAGVGKGRQIAGIILDNWARGRRRHVWMSTSSDLHLDAERDLRALGLHVPVIDNCQHLDRETRAVGLSQDLKEGVLFMTYSTLVMPHKGKSRLQQVIDWVGGPEWSGCLVFDEAHKAKNFVAGKEGQSTKVATCVLEIQKRLPKARVVYCSATGVSEVGNMAYMSRLGLWGAGSAFPDFSSFLESMKKRGVSFLEMLAMEMKSEGYYVARGLSFRQAEFLELECTLTPEQTAMYDGAVVVWQALKDAIGKALERTGTSSRDIWKMYWAAQQRFFKLLCISVKIPMVVEEAKKALAEGYAVVIGLQSTGEASADALGLQPGNVCGFVSVARELLSRFISTHFPVRIEDKQQGQEAATQRAPARFSPECLAMQRALLKAVDDLQLPPNFLDELVDALGGPSKVAEMTGRRGRIVRDPAGRGVYQLRARSDSSEMDSLNVAETAAFMRGDKLVAIVSDAASTGISLHAAQDAGNTRRRLHLTIELPWSADKAIQQLGRSHRSNQVSAPMYKLVVSSIGGEKRFAAAVARRLQSLGALTRADRRAASGLDLSESNFDSPLGRKSLRRMYDAIVQESPLLPPGVHLADIMEGCLGGGNERVLESLQQGTFSARDYTLAVMHLHQMLRDCVDMMGVTSNSYKHSDTVGEDTSSVDAKSSAIKELGDVRRFLNRLLGLPVARQNLLFNYFAVTLTAEIRSAKTEGRYFEGVSDLPGAVTRMGDPQVLWVDQYGGLKTMRHDLSMDRGISFEAACAKLEHEAVSGDQSGWRRSRRPMFGHVMYLLAIQKRAAKNLFVICRPNTGVSYFEMDADELEMKYESVSKEEAEEGWRHVFEESMKCCMHGPKCAQGPDCQVGKRQVPVTILAGSVVRVWPPLEAVLSRHEGMLSKSDRTMRVVRVDFGDGQILIGVRYPAHLLPEVVAALTAAQLLMPPPQALAKGIGEDALQASAMGAVGAVAVESPTPVDKKSLAKALRPPRSILSFFNKVKPATAAAGTPIKSEAQQPPKCVPEDTRASRDQPKPPGSTLRPHTQSGAPAVPSHGQYNSPQAAPPARKGRGGEQGTGVVRMACDTGQGSPGVPTGPCYNAFVIDVTGEDSEDEAVQRPKKQARVEKPGPSGEHPRGGVSDAAGPHKLSNGAVQGHVTSSHASAGDIPCSRSAAGAHWRKAAVDSGREADDVDMLDGGAGEPLVAGLKNFASVHGRGAGLNRDERLPPAAVPCGYPREAHTAQPVAEGALGAGSGGLGDDLASRRTSARLSDACHSAEKDAAIGADASCNERASGSLPVGSLPAGAGAGTDADGLGTVEKCGHDRGKNGGEGRDGGEGVGVGTGHGLGGVSVGKENGGAGFPQKGQGQKGVEVKGQGPADKAAKKAVPGKQTHEERVSTLMAMGFTSLQVERALKVTQGDIERAANWLLAGM